MAERIAAFVPMRHESERVRGKNYRALGGRPLFHHIVSTLLACPEIGEVVIDTDSDLIAANASVAFPQVRLIERPMRLRGGDVPMNEVLLHDVEVVDADVYVQTHSTNPFLRAATVSEALRTFTERRPEVDSLFTVTPLQTRLWWPDGQPINHDPKVLLRTQDLPPVLEENSSLYAFDKEVLQKGNNRIGERPLLWPISPQEALDIDEELDWRIVEALWDEESSS